jgi:hypothetical protein
MGVGHKARSLSKLDRFRHRIKLDDRAFRRRKFEGPGASVDARRSDLACWNTYGLGDVSETLVRPVLHFAAVAIGSDGCGSSAGPRDADESSVYGETRPIHEVGVGPLVLSHGFYMNLRSE